MTLILMIFDNEHIVYFPDLNKNIYLYEKTKKDKI